MLTRRQTLTYGLVGLAPFADKAHAVTERYPSKPISLVISYGPGGNADLRARMLGIEAAKMLGGTVIVENKPGANGNIGHEYVSRAAPDGYTLLIATMGPMVVSSFIYPKLGFDPQTSFEPIVLIEKAPMVLVTKTDKPFKTLQELIAYGRNNPNQLAFGNAGTGSAHHLAAELFMQSTGIHGLSVPYKGGSQAATALLAGEIDVLFEQTYAVMPSIQTGKVRALAVTSEKRLPSLPNVATMNELGYPKVLVHNWLGLAAPKGTPIEVLQKLNQVFNQALIKPEVREKITAPGNIVGSGTSEEFKAFILSERRKWEPVVKALNIKPD